MLAYKRQARPHVMQELHLVDWSDFIGERVRNATETERARQCRWGTARRKGQVDPVSNVVTSSAGDARIRIIRRLLDSYEGFPRSEAQKRFHDAFIKACLPHIYTAQDFEKFREKILAENGMEKVDYEILVCTPRRFGKTTAVAMYCAALLACVPDMWIRCVTVLRVAPLSRLTVPSRSPQCFQYWPARQLLTPRPDCKVSSHISPSLANARRPDTSAGCSACSPLMQNAWVLKTTS